MVSAIKQKAKETEDHKAMMQKVTAASWGVFGVWTAVLAGIKIKAYLAPAAGAAVGA